jgi:4-amino-4-deoxy-L-arabinose transferase-like glycosyltransferase
VSSPETELARERPLDDARATLDASVSKRTTTGLADRRLGWMILLLFCAAFALKVGGDLNAPFGFLPTGSSVDAYNAATWSTGARALRESGPIDSKFGAVWSDVKGDRYAHHPPGIYSATALAQWLVSDDELGARLLVFLAGLVAAVLLFVLLCDLDLAPVLAAASVGIGFSIPMFLTFGTMLDTVMLGLPFAAGYLVLWQRSLRGRPRYIGLAAAAAAVCLVAWEGVVLVAVTMLVTAVVGRDRERWTAIVAAGAGAASAVIVTGLWQVWVYGDLSDVLDQGALRAGGGGQSIGDYVDSQFVALRETFGVPALVVLGVGMVVLLASRRFRPVGVAALATPVIYAVGFREGSYIHDYWNYWLIITFVVGIGALASLLEHVRLRSWLLVGCVVAALLVVVGFRAELDEQRLRTDGERYAQAQAGFTKRAHGQAWVPLVSSSLGPPGSLATWVFPQARFYFGVPLRFATARAAASYARRHPHAWVVLNNGATGGGELVRGRDAVARLR